MAKKRILSGMRPTGKLHLGHYVGALENWIQLQNEYESFHLIADYHVLTTKLDTSEIYNDSIDHLRLLNLLSFLYNSELFPYFYSTE